MRVCVCVRERDSGIEKDETDQVIKEFEETGIYEKEKGEKRAFLRKKRD